MGVDPSFSFDDFKSWLTNNGQFPNKEKKSNQPNKITETLVGQKVEPRLGVVRLQEKIKENNPKLNSSMLAESFKKNGATIKEMSGLAVILEISGKSVKLPRMYVKLKECDDTKS
jgi:hypothetical protein